MLVNWTGRLTQVHPRRGKSPANFFIRRALVLSELSIFIDESGDFGNNSKYYLLTLVLHEQDSPIDEELAALDESLASCGFPTDCAIHTGPIVRREEMYTNRSVDERKRILSKLFAFTRRVGVKYMTFAYKKREFDDRFKLKQRMARDLSLLIDESMGYFTSFNKVIAYYDNGQSIITDVIGTVFAAKFFEVDFRKVLLAQYRLFQSADLICTLELLRMKIDAHELSASELAFFKSERDLKKNYLKQIERLRFEGK